MNEKDKEAFDKWFENNWQDSDDKDVFTQAWHAACEYKQARLAYHIYKIELENSLLIQEIEKFKGYLEAWGKDE